MGIADFFAKKDSPKSKVEEELKKKILEVKMKKEEEKTSVSSVKRTVKKTKKPVEKKAKKQIEVQRKPLAVEISVFYSKIIHRVYFNNHWYFFLEDVLAQCQNTLTDELIKELKNNKEYQKDYKDYVVELVVDLEGKTKIVECIDDKGFMWLLPLVRDDKRIFPGPFPDWLRESSHLPPPSSLNN